MTPDEDTQVMPARATVAGTPQPAINASAAPGIAFRTPSMTPIGAWLRMLALSSSAEYSKPSMSRSRMTPMSAATLTNSRLADSARNPPWPKANPAKR